MAVNGKQGLEMLAQERPDLVFLDYMMPVMDGAGLLRGRAADPSLRDIPVVIMSSLPEATVAERCHRLHGLNAQAQVTDVVSLTKRLIGAP